MLCNSDYKWRIFFPHFPIDCEFRKIYTGKIIGNFGTWRGLVRVICRTPQMHGPAWMHRADVASGCTCMRDHKRAHSTWDISIINRRARVARVSVYVLNTCTQRSTDRWTFISLIHSHIHTHIHILSLFLSLYRDSCVLQPWNSISEFHLRISWCHLMLLITQSRARMINLYMRGREIYVNVAKRICKKIRKQLWI